MKTNAPNSVQDRVAKPSRQTRGPEFAPSIARAMLPDLPRLGGLD